MKNPDGTTRTKEIYLLEMIYWHSDGNESMLERRTAIYELARYPGVVCRIERKVCFAFVDIACLWTIVHEEPLFIMWYFHRAFFGRSSIISCHTLSTSRISSTLSSRLVRLVLAECQLHSTSNSTIGLELLSAKRPWLAFIHSSCLLHHLDTASNVASIAILQLAA